MKVTPSGRGVLQLNWAPGVQDTGDLESASKTIAATVEASGLGSADYSHSVTIPAVPDSRLIVLQVGVRLNVDVNALGTGATLNCRVYVDAQDAAHRLFDEAWTTSGNKLDAVTLSATNLPTAFALLADGAAHTLYFFFWKSVAGTGGTTVDVVEAWAGVGGNETQWYNASDCLRIKYPGMVTILADANRTGAGTTGIFSRPYQSPPYTQNIRTNSVTGNPAVLGNVTLITSDHAIATGGDTATDLYYLDNLNVTLG